MTVRKTVTVLFADVVDSTATGEQLDPEVVRRLMARWFDDARTIVESHGGTVEKFIGDAVMAVFGIPTAHEDDALRAVRAAAELRERVAAVRLRIGVNTGEVVAGEGETLVTGDAVNVAARLQQAAAPDAILIGEATYRLVPAAVDVKTVPPLSAKGKSEPVAAYELRNVERDADAFVRRFDTPLVGRERELTELRRAYERTVEASHCELVTIVGDPGIGKSRLAQELVEVIEPGARVLSGRCLPYGEGITYWPLVQIERELERSGESVDEQVKVATGASAGAATSAEIFAAVRKLLERLARERPLVVVLDDLQWAEPTFVDLVEHVLKLARDAPILLIGLARPELLDSRPGWPGVLVRLEALSDSDSEQLVRNLGADGRADVVAAGGGNPLFIEQILAFGDTDAIPPTVHAVLAARLDRLGPAARHAIECASIVGEEFWMSAIRHLVPENVDVRRALLELGRRGFVRQTEPATFAEPEAFRFAHILVRDAAYSGVTKESRARLHESFARWVEERDAERGVAYDEIVGYHFEQAFRLGVEVELGDERIATEAGVRLHRAGVRALDRGDVGAAVSLLARARGLLPRHDVRRLQAGEKLAVALRSYGELARAEDVIDETIVDARAAGETALAERVVLLRFAHAIMDGGATGDEVRAAVERAIPLFEEAGDESGLAYAWGLYGGTRWMEHRIHDSYVARERALEHARKAADHELELGLTTALVAHLSTGMTPIDVAIARLDEIAGDVEDRPLLQARLLKTRASLHAMRGEFDRARDLMDRGIALEHDLGQSVSAAIAEAARAGIEELAGDDEAAERLMREACETLQTIGERSYFSSCAGHLANLLCRLHRFEEAAEWIVVSEDVRPAGDVDAQALSHAVRAKLLARDGEFEQAARLARAIVDLLEPTDFGRKGHYLADAAEVLGLTGQRGEAEALFTQAKAIFEEKGNVAALRLIERRVREALGAVPADRLV